jgi:hypothetical protein
LINAFCVYYFIVDSPTTLTRKMTCLSGGLLLDPHDECGLSYKYFPMDSVLKFHLVEDLILWSQGYGSHLVNMKN